MSDARLTRYAWLSVAAAVATIALKATAFLLTGSVGLLSDALESLVNLAAAIIAVIALTVAARPADESHHWGHGKAEYFSAGVEGLMIFVAAAAIVVTSIERLLHPRTLDRIGVGIAVSIVAALVNLVVALVLLRVGRRARSLTLVADGRHLLTDVWTSGGVVVGVFAVGVTGWRPLDPLVALAVGANILVAGVSLLRRSVSGLMDRALPLDDLDAIDAVLQPYASEGVIFHAIRTREAGRRRFIAMHVLVPGAWSVQQAHDIATRVEDDLAAALPGVVVTTHVEPVEDPAAYADPRV